MEETENRILLALFKKQMNFREIVTELDCGRNGCRRRLTELSSKKMIVESPKTWNAGQEKQFKLTEKGRQECMRISAAAISQSLKDLAKQSTAFFSDPALLREWMISETNNKDPVKSASTFDKLFNDPLLSISQDLHKAMCYLLRTEALPADYVTILRDGNFRVESVHDLKKYTNLIAYLDLFITPSDVEKMTHQGY